MAPLIRPLLDRFRHGRRFALSASLFLRAVLAWVISVNTEGTLGLYFAAFGMVLLSRGYGMTRSAALARLVPSSGLRLSQASARATVFATIAGTVAGVFGFVAAWIGPQWPLRLSSLFFVVGAVIALNLPPLADTEPPEVLPRPFGLPWRGRTRGPDGTRGEPILSGRSVGVAVLGAGGLRVFYGFLVVFLAFAVRSDALGGGLLVVNGEGPQLAVVGAAFGVGALIATVTGIALRSGGRPVPLLTAGVVMVGLAGLWATVRFSFLSILLLCLCTALASGLAKVAVDTAIQERVPERDRANAFARTETLLMLTWLAGAAIGLVPGVPVRLGIAVAGLVALVVIGSAVVGAWRMRGEAPGGYPAPAPGQPVTGELLHRGAGPLALSATAAAPPAAPASPIPSPPATTTSPGPTPPTDEAPPGFHIFRPSPPPADPPVDGT